MKTSSALTLLACFAFPLELGASGPELFGVIFKSSQPILTEDLPTSVEDPEQLERAIDENSSLMKRISQIKYQIVGRADPSECSDSPCTALALRRAELFQQALIQAGVPSSSFCTPLALGAPWPSEYSPKPEEMIFSRQAIVEPIFDDCTPNNSFKPTPLRGAA